MCVDCIAGGRVDCACWLRWMYVRVDCTAGGRVRIKQRQRLPGGDASLGLSRRPRLAWHFSGAPCLGGHGAVPRPRQGF